jgi:hypothetical protein
MRLHSLGRHGTTRDYLGPTAKGEEISAAKKMLTQHVLIKIERHAIRNATKVPTLLGFQAFAALVAL